MPACDGDRQTDGRTVGQTERHPDRSYTRGRVQLTAGPRSAAGAAPTLGGQIRDTRHDLPTNRPDTRTAAVLPVPSCKLGNAELCIANYADTL